MAFPSGLAIVNLHIKVDEWPAGGAVGNYSITNNRWLTGAAEDSIVRPVVATGELETDGTKVVPLPATDDPDWTPQGWSYSLWMSVDGKVLKATFELDHMQTDVQLADVIVIDGSVEPGQTYIPLSLRGADNGVASLDSDGLLPLGQLPAHSHAIGDVTGLTAALAGKPDLAVVRSMEAARLMLLDDTEGEEAVPRGDVLADWPLTSGRLHLTGFFGRKTAHRITFTTQLGGTPGVGGTHCWVMVYELVAGSWVRRGISVDDPTRWAGSAYAVYDTPMVWDEVEGNQYAAGFLWIGGGAPPTLPAARVWFGDALKKPMTHGYLDGLGGATSTVDIPNPLNPAFLGANDTRFQAKFKS